MDADMKKTLDQATDAVQSAMGSVTDTTKDTASDVMQIASDAAEKAGALVSDGVSGVRSAYDENPVRTITIAALSVAGLIAIITALVRRAA